MQHFYVNAYYSRKPSFWRILERLTNMAQVWRTQFACERLFFNCFRHKKPHVRVCRHRKSYFVRITFNGEVQKIHLHDQNFYAGLLLWTNFHHTILKIRSFWHISV